MRAHIDWLVYFNACSTEHAECVSCFSLDTGKTLCCQRTADLSATSSVFDTIKRFMQTNSPRSSSSPRTSVPEKMPVDKLFFFFFTITNFSLIRPLIKAFFFSRKIGSVFLFILNYYYHSPRIGSVIRPYRSAISISLPSRSNQTHIDVWSVPPFVKPCTLQAVDFFTLVLFFRSLLAQTHMVIWSLHGIGIIGHAGVHRQSTQ